MAFFGLGRAAVRLCPSRFQPLGDRVGHPLARGMPGRLEGEGGDAEPGDPEGPAAQHVGDVVHAEQDPADPDQRDERDDAGDEGAAPPAAGRGQEDQENGPVGAPG